MKPDKDKPKPVAKKTSGKVFDVRRPGKAPASPTSRPVIMGHKPEAQEAQTAVSGIGEARPLLTKRKIQIVPMGVDGTGAPKASSIGVTLSQDKSTDPAQQQGGADKTAVVNPPQDTVTGPPNLPAADESRLAMNSEHTIQPPTLDVKAETAPEPPERNPAEQPEVSQPQKTEPEPAPQEQLVESTSVPDEPTAPDAPQLQEDPAPEPNIEPLFNDSGVIVSTHDHHHSNHTMHVLGLLLLIVLLAAVALNVLLDLGLLTLEGLPHTDLL